MADAAPKKRSGLAIASFVLGLLSCLCFPAPIALVLGVIALVQTGRNPNLSGRGFAIAGVSLGAVLGLLSMLAAMAIPSYMRYPVRAKQSECKSNLKGLYTAARWFNDEKGHYTADFAGLEFSPERGRRYAYLTAASPIAVDEGRTVLMPDKSTVTLDEVKAALSTTQLAGGVRPGVEGVCPDDCTFTAICIGNIDDDEELDIWSISTKERTGPEGPIGAGMVNMERNDAD